MKVRGDSMAPVARDGQYALLAPDRRSARDGDLVVVSVHDAGIYSKRFFRLPDQDLVSLHSINPVISIPPIVVPEGRLDDLRVVIGIRFE
jgi:phage repressor protein C with HTH and peptisase S24 domain